MKVYDSPIVEHHISPMIEAFSKILCAKPRAYIATQGKKFFDFIECRKSCAVRFHLAGKENAPRQSGDSSGPIVKPSKKSVVEPPPRSLGPKSEFIKRFRSSSTVSSTLKSHLT